MQPLLTAQEMQKAERDCGINLSTLMKNAAEATAKTVLEHFGNVSKLSAVAFVGPGNNGQDCLLTVELLKQAGLKNWQINPKKLDSCDLILDGIFGIGLNRNPEGNFKEAIDAINQSKKAWIISLDIPSGLRANTGMPFDSCVVANQTISYGFYKRGHVTGLAGDYVGKLSLDPLSIPRKVSTSCFLIEKADLPKLPFRKPSHHKGLSGHVGILAGKPELFGACVLSCLGALHLGAGKVSLVLPKGQTPSRELPPEVMTFPLEDLEKSEFQSLVVGPGLGFDEKIFARAWNLPIPLVVDADGITLLAKNLLPLRSHPTMLSPHPKEASALLGCSTQEVQEDRYKAIEKITEKYQATCILKGFGSLISAPKESIYVCPFGNPALAKGGTGDFLSGILGGLLAQGMKTLDAAILGSALHGLSAEAFTKKGFPPHALLPSELSLLLREVMMGMD